jgi:putative transposase
MARLARLVVPGLPHHVTQRGNRRHKTFFEEGDYALYLDLLSASSRRASTEVWAYCLMPNHVHMVVVPSDEDGLRRTFADLHRRYTGYVNARARTTGHLWQGRYGSVILDENHLFNAVRYVTLNPVRAGLAARARDWPWSSARAHLAGVDDSVVTVAPVLERVGDVAAFLSEPCDERAGYAALRRGETIGRPIGDDAWLRSLEARTGRTLAPGRRGRKPGGSREARASRQWTRSPVDTGNVGGDRSPGWAWSRGNWGLSKLSP